MASMQSFSDDFNDNSIDSGKWGILTPGSGRYAETNGRFEITTAIGTDEFDALYSQSRYDLTGSYAAAQLVEAGDQSIATLDAYMLLYPNGTNALVFFVGNGSIYAQKQISGTYTVFAGDVYDPVDHQFLRIREASGTCYWETSPDGITWNSFASLANPFAVTNLWVDIGGGIYGTETVSTDIYWDNFNVEMYHEGAATLAGDAEIIATAITEQATSTDITGSASIVAYGRNVVATQPIDRKYCTYKIYDNDGVFLGEWHNEVITPFTMTRTINTASPVIEIELARTGDTRAVSEESLTTEDDIAITTESAIELVSLGSTVQPFGVGTTVNVDNRVEIFVYFGGIGELQQQNGATIDDQSTDPLQITIGSPNGRMIMTGFISGYRTRYGDNMTTLVTVKGFGAQLDEYVLEAGDDTRVAYLSTAPQAILQSVVDAAQADGLEINYTDNSIESTGTIVSYTYKLNTYMEAVQKLIELCPADWFWFYNPADNTIWLRDKPTTPDHTFVYKKHIMRLEAERFTDQMINTVYFKGGVPDPIGAPDVHLFKKYVDAASVAEYGQKLKIITDERVTLTTTADILAQSEIDRYKDPLYTIQTVISADVYPIEDIQLGQLVAFTNFDNFVDDIEAQVVGIEYTLDYVVLQLGVLLPSINKRVIDIKRNLDAMSAVAMPDTPTS
jgi:hypothetical protein